MNKTDGIKKQKWIAITVIIVCSILIAILIFSKFCTSKIEFYFMGITNHYALVSLIIIIVIMIRLLCYNSIKRKALANVITILLIADIIFLSSFSNAFSGYCYTSVHSPDGKKTIVAKEYSFLFGGSSEIYQQINPFFIKKIGEIRVDDGNKPFYRDEYYINWEDNQIIIRHSFDPGSDEDKFVEDTIKLLP